ncbi:MAG: septum formation initiator family protein [Elusimicrobia bacterium]|nr:septum formation initiator family protein [Elusimicrobiota bacterium]
MAEQRRIFGPNGRPWWRRGWVWGSVALVVVMFGNSGFRRLISRWRELRKLKHELAELKTEEAKLQERIKSSQKAGPSLERAARKELGYLKPGEVEYRFPPPKKAD